MEFDNFNQLCEYVNAYTNDELIYLTFKEKFNEYNLESQLTDSIIENRGILDEFSLKKYNIYLGTRIINYITDIKENINKYIFLHDHLLKDLLSKKVLFNLLAYRIIAKEKYIIHAYNVGSEQYFDSSIIKCKPNSVFIDCGGLDGTTTAQFILKYTDFSKVYIYEPMDTYYNECIENVRKMNLNNIFIRKSAVYNNKTMLTFSQNTRGQSRADLNGDIKVSAVTLDEDIQEPIDFIKMDIEGSEQKALQGAKNHIEKEMPILAICAYHLSCDLWKIPEIIYNINSNYTFYLRHHTMDISETVFYAVPNNLNNINRQINKEKLPIEAELECLKLVTKFNKKEIDSLYETKVFLVDQVENYKKSLENAENVISENEKWITELKDGKCWLEKQYNTYLSESKQKDKMIKELQQWTEEQQKAKVWLEEQYNNYKNECNRKNKIIEELTVKKKEN